MWEICESGRNTAETEEHCLEPVCTSEYYMYPLGQCYSPWLLSVL
uniref:Uncharacterized protein n=1 Tax=Anguilla anguilla TaxID=7936 RepID=A0A0E9WFN9_ANGAN